MTELTITQLVRGAAVEGEHLRRLPPGAERDAGLVNLYRRVRRQPPEKTMEAALIAHAQACGLVAYVANDLPEHVARCVERSRPHSL